MADVRDRQVNPYENGNMALSEVAVSESDRDRPSQGIRLYQIIQNSRRRRKPEYWATSDIGTDEPRRPQQPRVCSRKSFRHLHPKLFSPFLIKPLLSKIITASEYPYLYRQAPDVS